MVGCRRRCRNKENVMSLLGKGAMVIWHDIAAGCESDYNE